MHTGLSSVGPAGGSQSNENKAAAPAAVRKRRIKNNPARRGQPCTMQGCTNKIVARAICIFHGALGTCQIDGCGNKVYKKGFCQLHVNRCSGPGVVKEAEAAGLHQAGIYGNTEGVMHELATVTDAML